MNHIVAEQHRNTESRIFHTALHHSVAQLGVVTEIDDRTRLGRHLLHRLSEIVFDVVPAKRILVQLEDLLFESHPGEKVFYPALDRG